MKINDLHKLPYFSLKVITPYESLNYIDKTKENTVFISDSIPLTNLFSAYDKKFSFSKKFNRNMFLNKYIRTGKLNYNRDLNKTRSLLFRNHVLFTSDEKEADCYDLTLESSTFHKIYQGSTLFNRFETYLKDDQFLKSKQNINIFWILDHNHTSKNLNDLYLIMLQRYKDSILDPKHNKNIKNIFALCPYNESESKDVALSDLKFLISRIYDEKKEELEFPRIKAQIQRMIEYVEKLSKTDLIHIKKSDIDNLKQTNPDTIHPIDITYIEHNENDDISNKHLSLGHEDENIRSVDIKNVDESNTYPADKNQIDKYTNSMLLKDYMAKSFNDDMISMTNHALKSFNPNLEVVDMKIENADDGITDQDRYIFKVQNNDSKTKSSYELKILVPRLIENKFFKVYNKVYTLSNQVYSNLINKIKEDTVAFTSSHTKTIVYIQGRSDDRIGKYFAKNELDVPKYEKYVVSDNPYIPNSLHVIFKYATAFNYKDYVISYDVYNLHMSVDENTQIIGLNKKYYPKDISILSKKDVFKKYIENIIAKHGNDSVVIYNFISDSINNKPFLLEMKNFLENYDKNIKNMPIPGSSQFARMNIAGKKLPVIIVMLIAYLSKFQDASLSNFFDKYFPENVHVDFSEKNIHEDNVISIKYKDGYANIFVYQSLIGAELLFSILRKIDLSEYSKADIDSAGLLRLMLYAYFKTQKLDPSLVIRSIDVAINSILDPITIQLLENSNYEYSIGSNIIKPRDIIQLLYYCVYLLNDRTYKIGNDFSGYRIRNMETIPAILYKLLSKASAESKNSGKSFGNKSNGSRVSIIETALLDEFRSLTTFESFSDLNISNEIGLTSKATYKGFAGINNNRSISYDLRATNPSSIGYIDVGNNVDNMNIGSNRMMPFNPNISDIRGIDGKIKNLRQKVMNNEKLTDFETSSILSFDTYNEPFLVKSADAPRVNMASIQARHGIPLDSYDDLPIKTGIEDALKDVVSSSFVIKSPKVEPFYKVKSINTDKKIIVLKGSKGAEYEVSFKDKVANNSGGGFCLLKEFEPCVKVGQTVKADKAVALDKGSFRNNNYTNAKMLYTTYLHFAETYEDSGFIAESVAKKLEFNYVTEKTILIRNDQTIINCIKEIGTSVEVDQPILVFSKDDKESKNKNVEKDDIFSVLNQDLEENDGLGLKSYIKSKYPGKIVDIKIEYNGEKLRNIPELVKLSKSLPKENIKQIRSNKMNGYIVSDGTLITYYILTKIPAMSGSKLTNQSTKSVFIVKPDSEMPRDMNGKMIECCISTFSCLTRMTVNNFNNLYLNKCIYKLREELKKNIK